MRSSLAHFSLLGVDRSRSKPFTKCEVHWMQCWLYSYFKYKARCTRPRVRIEVGFHIFEENSTLAWSRLRQNWFWRTSTVAARPDQKFSTQCKQNWETQIVCRRSTNIFRVEGITWDSISDDFSRCWPDRWASESNPKRFFSPEKCLMLRR